MNQPPQRDERQSRAGWLDQRLSIAHLLAITIGTAISVALMQVPGPPPTMAQAAITAVFAPAYGAGIASLAFAASDLVFYRKPIAAQPGHLLLLIIGALFCGVTLLLRVSSFPDLGWIELFTGLLPGAYFLGLTLWITLFAINRAGLHPRWRAVFHHVWVSLAMTFCCCPLQIFVLPSLTVMTFIAIHTDSTEGLGRNLWHWVGVAAMICALVHVMTFIVISLVTGVPH